MKKWIMLFLCLLMLLPQSVPAHAAAPKIVDDADLLTEQQEAKLEEKAQALIEQYQMDVVIVTNESLGGKSSESFADDYFDENGYGIGSDASGVLFLLSMEYRDWAISTTGDSIYALTDYGIQTLFSDIAGYLSEDDYYRAFDKYLTELDHYFRAYRDGSPIDGNPGIYDGPGTYHPSTQDEIVTSNNLLRKLPRMLLIGLLVGALAGGIVLVVMISQMRTAKPQSGAKEYMKPGTYELCQRSDVFLYSHVSKSVRAQSSSGGGRGGSHGSSIHTGSSGRSHGGGHGKF